jgi:molybdopterin-guanine dinucleotide biosynthesis protein A
MGRDKAVLPWGQTDMLNTVLEALRPSCSQLIVVSDKPREIKVPDVLTVADKYTGCGPMGGVHAGLIASGSDYNFVAACDMPYINYEAVLYMASLASGYDALVPCVLDRLHPLHAIYHRRCIPLLEELLRRKKYKITELYPKINMRYLEGDELAAFDAKYRMLSNINNLDDYCKCK